MSDLIAAVRKAVHEIHKLERTVSNHSSSSQVVLFDRINRFVRELQGVKAAGERSEQHAPIEVVRFLDSGRNPDDFTRSLLLACVEANAAARGRVDAFKSLRGHLLKQLDRHFPEEVEEYRLLRRRSHELTQAAPVAVKEENGSPAAAPPPVAAPTAAMEGDSAAGAVGVEVKSEGKEEEQGDGRQGKRKARDDAGMQGTSLDVKEEGEEGGDEEKVAIRAVKRVKVEDESRMEEGGKEVGEVEEGETSL